MATIEEATLIFRLPESSLPRKETSPFISLVEAADEIFVTGDHHHDDEAGHQCGIDEAEDGPESCPPRLVEDASGDL